MDTPPSLGPNPEKLIPWMRWATRAIQNFNTRWDRSNLDQVNNNKQLNSTVSQLSDQLNAMAIVKSDSIYERNFSIPVEGDTLILRFRAPEGKSKVTIQVAGGVVGYEPTRTHSLRNNVRIGSSNYIGEFVSPAIGSTNIDYSNGQRASNAAIAYSATLECNPGDEFTITYGYATPEGDTYAWEADLDNTRTLGYTATFYN